MTYTNPGLCHVVQDDTEGGREGFCDQLCQKRRLKMDYNGIMISGCVAVFVQEMCDDY